MVRKTLTIAIFNESSRWVLPDRFVDRIRDAAGDGFAIKRVHSSHELKEALPETAYLVGFPATEIGRAHV